MQRPLRINLPLHLSALLALFGLLCLSPAQATGPGKEVAGVKLVSHAQVGNSELILNGAGLRKRIIFQVYVAGLYLPQRETQAAAILASDSNKRMHLVMLRDVSAESFLEALQKGMASNLTAAELEAIKTRMDGFSQLLLGLGSAHKGDVIQLDQTAAGSQVIVNGKPQGTVIPGADFYRALLKVWLGEHPVQDDLKHALLGVAS